MNTYLPSTRGWCLHVLMPQSRGSRHRGSGFAQHVEPSLMPHEMATRRSLLASSAAILILATSCDAFAFAPSSLALAGRVAPRSCSQIRMAAEPPSSDGRRALLGKIGMCWVWVKVSGFGGEGSGRGKGSGLTVYGLGFRAWGRFRDWGLEDARGPNGRLTQVSVRQRWSVCARSQMAGCMPIRPTSPGSRRGIPAPLPIISSRRVLERSPPHTRFAS